MLLALTLRETEVRLISIVGATAFGSQREVGTKSLTNSSKLLGKSGIEC